MQLFYNSFGIHQLGEFTLTTSREIEEGQRARVTVKVVLTVFEEAYDANFALLQQLKEKVRTQQAILQWHNEEVNKDYINQTAMLVSDDLPEEWGQYQQEYHLAFSYWEQNLVTNNMPLVCSPAGGNALTLGNVLKFTETLSIERVSPFKSARKEARVVIKASGYVLADTTLSLDDRRVALKDAKKAIDTALRSSGDVTMQYGWDNSSQKAVLNQVVRIQEVETEADQLREALNWSITANYTAFPNEANFATVEYEVDQQDANTGEQSLTFSGRITSTDVATAQARLAALTPVILAQYGYAVNAQQLQNDSKESWLEANADGTVFVELTFTQKYRRWRSDNQQATYKKTGSTSPTGISFGNVSKWDLTYMARRFNEQRSQRQFAGGQIEASGTFLGDPALTLAQRRTQLLAAQAAMYAEVSSPDGTLTYGAFTQIVRVSNFKAEINQTLTGIDWSFSASYSLFPNEASYATVEFTVAQRSNVEEGEDFMSFSGRILAPDEALARAKLGTLRTTLLTNYAFTLPQQLRSDVSVSGVFANGEKTAGYSAHEASDGTTFIELTFQEEYRRRNATLLGSTMKVTTRDDVTAGMVMTTFSGTVTASGPSVDAAYTIAVTEAQRLGSGKESQVGPAAFMRLSTISWDQRQTQAANAPEFIRLEFSYEYQAKSARLFYLELANETMIDAFGNNTVSISGNIVAVDAATAADYYARAIREPLIGKIVRNERTGTSYVSAFAFTSGGTLPTPQQQLTRMDFSLTVLQDKVAGFMAYRYGLDVSKDFVTLEQATHIQGSVYAINETAALSGLNVLIASLGLSTANQTHSNRRIDKEYTSELVTLVPPGPVGAFLKYDFDETYVAKLTGVSGILEMRVTEEIQYSGPRYVRQPIPANDDGTGGITLIQNTGTEEGGRNVRGTVSAADKATAINWAKAQQALLTGDSTGNRYPLPGKLDIDYEFIPRISGVIGGGGENVKLWRVNFTFGEILPSYPMP